MSEQNGDERRSDRSSVRLVATLEHGGTELPVKLLNLSAHGALVSGNNLPEAETPIIFRRNGVEIEGCLAWVQGSCGGLEFRHALNPKDVLRSIPQPRQQVLRQVRRPGLRANEISDQKIQIVHQWSRAERDRPGE